MRNLFYAVVAAVMLPGCAGMAGEHISDDRAEMADSSVMMPVLPLSVLDSASDENSALVANALNNGSPRDLAIAFHYYFHQIADGNDNVRKAIEVYDRLKTDYPDSYCSVLYELSHEIEKRNYGRMVDRQVDHLRYISGRSHDSVSQVE